MYDFKLVSWFKSSNYLQSVVQQTEGDISQKSICRHVCNCLYSFINVGNLLHWILKQQWRNAALVLALEQPYLTLHNLCEVFAFLTKKYVQTCMWKHGSKIEKQKKCCQILPADVCVIWMKRERKGSTNGPMCNIQRDLLGWTGILKNTVYVFC